MVNPIVLGLSVGVNDERVDVTMPVVRAGAWQRTRHGLLDHEHVPHRDVEDAGRTNRDRSIRERFTTVQERFIVASARTLGGLRIPCSSIRNELRRYRLVRRVFSGNARDRGYTTKDSSSIGNA